MIRCWIFQNEIRLHLDEGGAISQRTRAHLDGCLECKELLRTHSVVVRRLRALESDEAEIPFLRARVLRAIQSGVETPHSKTLRVVWTVAGAACVALILTVLLPKQKTVAPEVAAPSWELPKFAAAPVEVTGSLETELESLKSDTQRAARALATSFIPSDR